MQVKPTFHFLAVLLLLWIVAFSCHSLSLAGGDHSIQAAVKSWDNFLILPRDILGQYEGSIESGGEKEDFPIQKFQWRSKRGELYFANWIEWPDKTNVDIGNPNYFFKLKPSGKSTEFDLSSVKSIAIPDFPDVFFNARANLLFREAGGYATAQYALRGLFVHNAFLPFIVQSPYFNLQEAETNGEGAGLWKVTFSPPPGSQESFVTPFRGGTLTLDPKNYWQLISARDVLIDFPDGKAVGSLDNTYVNDEGTSYVSNSLWIVKPLLAENSTTVTSRSKITFVTDHPTAFKKNAFTLTAFGLKEPVFNTDRKFRGVFFFLSLAFISLLIAIFSFKRLVANSQN